MSRGLNEAQFRGNLVEDPELKYVGDSAVVNTAIGVSSSYKNRDGDWVEKTTYVDLTFWDRNAEVLNDYASKGSLIFVKTVFQTRKWEDDRYTDEDGNPVTRYPSEFKVIRLDLLGSGEAPERGDDEDAGADDDPDDDLPF